MSSNQIVRYVQSYLACPTSEDLDKVFCSRMDRLIYICTSVILSNYLSLKSLNKVLEHLFPCSFLEKSCEYKPLFLNIEIVIMKLLCEYSCAPKLDYKNILENLSLKCSGILEYLVLKLSELYFLSSRNMDQFWIEVSQHSELEYIFKSFNVNEQVQFGDIEREFINSFNITKKSKKVVMELIDSYIVALIRCNIAENGIQNTD